MPTVSRDDFFKAAMVKAFHEFGLWQKVCQVATVFTTIICFVIPQELPVALGLKRPRQNVGRLKPVVEGQIYQQLYMSGNTQSTIFKSRKGDALLIYMPPRITNEFLNDVASLGTCTVKYIVAPNEAHESYADDAKKAFPAAKVITPKASRELVGEAVKVDATLEESLEMLETEFGFVKMFRYDDNSRCTAERSFCVELFGKREEGKNDSRSTEGCQSYCLFVGQCGIGNYSTLLASAWLAGFQSLFPPRGRYFRHYFYCFTTNQGAVRQYWTNMVQSIPGTLQAAVFIHGNPIAGPDTRAKLKQFYFY